MVLYPVPFEGPVPQTYKFLSIYFSRTAIVVVCRQTRQDFDSDKSHF